MDLNQVKQIESRLKQVTPSKVESLLKEEIQKNGQQIVNLVRTRWEKGLRPDGSIIGNYRSFAYEMEKRQRNPLAGGKVDLIDTGSLKDKLVVNYLGNALFNIFSEDKKAVMIAKKYGLDVYGLKLQEEEDVLLEAMSRVNQELFDFVGI